MTEQSPAEAIFFSALEKGAPEERAAYLDAACGEDARLRRRVERLIEAHPKAGDFLEPPAAAPTAAFASGGEQAGAIIADRYKLLEQIGEGGMGVVWAADQLEPIRRRVALKVIKPGMDSRAVLARFEAERQALALMDHPNIAKVLDAGTTADGRPFFVMELVKGTPITDFCDARKLTAQERLELFVPVCQAVQHAHQKGIIHRDLKPSNLLVALHDERPVPKVIDFGVAKAVGQQLTDKTIYTGFGALVGTPAYMAPEQAAFNALDVDTRADVYALGVLLYELLIGSPPFEPERLKKAALDEVLRLVREEDPPRPSNRLSTSHARASIAAVRQTDPERLTKLMRGELDWIVMKALEKDRNRRYDTATGLAADVRRYLTGEAVQAHPPSTAYRLRKFVRKHRVLLTTAAAFAVLLTAAAAASSWLAVEARRAEAAAVELRTEAETQAKRADHNAGMFARALMKADTSRRKAERLGAGLQIDLDLATSSNDSRLGLLRLCRTLKGMPNEQARRFGGDVPGELRRDAKVADPMTLDFVWGVAVFEDSLEDKGPSMQELRDFVTAAVLGAGQGYAPLLPPITHDGQPVENGWLSPDGRMVLTLGKDFTARLWDARTARQIALLRKGDERVVNCGFSPDGRTVFTDDKTSVARFWDVPGRKFLAQTEPRPSRYDDSAWPPPAVAGSPPWQAWEWLWPGGHGRPQLGNGRLLTQSLRQQQLKHENGGVEIVKQALGPCELWDTAIGRLVARLEGAAGRFLAGDMVAMYESPSTVRVYSANDGRLIARLDHPDPGPGQVRDVIANPSGRRLVTVFGPNVGKQVLRVWDTASWRELSRSEPTNAGLESFDTRFVTDEVIALETTGLLVGLPGPPRTLSLYRCEPDGRLTLITDARNYPPDPDGSTRDGPFGVERNGHEVSDSRARRSFGAGYFFTRESVREWHNLAGLGLVSPVAWDGGQYQLWLVPSSNRLAIPPDLLELWAQVAVRGELDKAGEFVKWDEPTWESKRQELAARPAPWPDFPFPGHAAADRLHWLRQEYGAASDAEKPGLAKHLLDRAEAAGDKAQASRWRAVAGQSSNLPQN